MPTPRKISVESVNEIAELMKNRMYKAGEILNLLKEKYHYNGSMHMFLELMDRQGIVVFEEENGKGHYLYKVLTNEDLEKYEEEYTRNAKRRLLATISS